MNTRQFDNVLNETLNACRTTLGNKAKEYAFGDRLSNFKRAGALNQSTPEQALKGMMSKHIISIYDLIDDVDKGKLATMAMWSEKIGDTINYLILLKALILERKDISAMNGK